MYFNFFFSFEAMNQQLCKHSRQTLRNKKPPFCCLFCAILEMMSWESRNFFTFSIPLVYNFIYGFFFYHSTSNLTSTTELPKKNSTQHKRNHISRKLKLISSPDRLNSRESIDVFIPAPYAFWWLPISSIFSCPFPCTGLWSHGHSPWVTFQRGRQLSDAWEKFLLRNFPRSSTSQISPRILTMFFAKEKKLLINISSKKKRQVFLCCFQRILKHELYCLKSLFNVSCSHHQMYSLEAAILIPNMANIQQTRYTLKRGSCVWIFN